MCVLPTACGAHRYCEKNGGAPHASVFLPAYYALLDTIDTYQGTAGGWTHGGKARLVTLDAAGLTDPATMALQAEYKCIVPEGLRRKIDNRAAGKIKKGYATAIDDNSTRLHHRLCHLLDALYLNTYTNRDQNAVARAPTPLRPVKRKRQSSTPKSSKRANLAPVTPDACRELASYTGPVVVVHPEGACHVVADADGPDTEPATQAGAVTTLEEVAEAAVPPQWQEHTDPDPCDVDPELEIRVVVVVTPEEADQVEIILPLRQAEAEAAVAVQRQDETEAAVAVRRQDETEAAVAALDEVAARDQEQLAKEAKEAEFEAIMQVCERDNECSGSSAARFDLEDYLEGHLEDCPEDYLEGHPEGHPEDCPEDCPDGHPEGCLEGCLESCLEDLLPSEGDVHTVPNDAYSPETDGTGPSFLDEYGRIFD